MKKRKDYIDIWLDFFKFYNPSTSEEERKEILKKLKRNKQKKERGNE